VVLRYDEPRILPQEAQMETEQKIRAYIAENLLFGDSAALSSSASLLATGTIDSTGVMDLVMFLETSFGIKVEDEDLVPDNLDSIDRLARFVERKRAANGGGAP
jgi:acyl carrier protein